MSEPTANQDNGSEAVHYLFVTTDLPSTIRVISGREETAEDMLRAFQWGNPIHERKNSKCLLEIHLPNYEKPTGALATDERVEAFFYIRKIMVELGLSFNHNTGLFIGKRFGHEAGASVRSLDGAHNSYRVHYPSFSTPIFQYNRKIGDAEGVGVILHHLHFPKLADYEEDRGIFSLDEVVSLDKGKVRHEGYTRYHRSIWETDTYKVAQDLATSIWDNYQARTATDLNTQG